jgi:hypothetical protein
MQSIVVIVGCPSRVIGEFSEASFEPLKRDYLGGAVCGPGQLRVFHSFGTILFSGKHQLSFLEKKISTLDIFGSVAQLKRSLEIERG